MMKTRIPVLLLALSLAACEPRQPQDVPPPPASPDNPAPAPAAPADTAPVPGQDPGSMPAAPAQPAPTAPAPTAPSATPKPTAANSSAPALESMSVARPSAKMSIAADLRYHFDAPVTDGQPAALQLAAIPRVAGENFKVEVKPAAGLEIARGTLALQKVAAAGVYRQQLSVVRHAGAPDALTVLVTMDMPEGTAFGFFSIPLASGQNQGGNPAQKLDSVKQR